MPNPAWTDLDHKIQGADPVRSIGQVTRMVGMIIEIAGLAGPLGSLCRIEIGRNQEPVLAEVVGFKDNSLLVMSP